MQLKKVYLGSWFPKTSLHLDELANFLVDGSVTELLDKELGIKIFKKLNPQNIALKEKNGIKYLSATAGKFDFAYFEDGLLMTSVNAGKNLKNSCKDLAVFYNNTLSSAFAFIYSRGAKGLEIIRQPGLSKSFFVTAVNANKKEIGKFFQSVNKKIKEVHTHHDISVAYADELVLVSQNHSSGRGNPEHLLDYIIFFDEVQRHLNKLLYMHRHIWDEADLIISKSSVNLKELPEDNAQLTEYSNTVANIKARIKQMKLNLNYRQKKMSKDTFFSQKVNNISQNLDYLDNLFEMTSTHLLNNVTELSSIYQNTQQTALNRLQMLFSGIVLPMSIHV